ncbi:MAG: rod-binding protein [Bdellovibrionota bacterium]|jgi:flagellar protein FlgJ
MADSKLGLGGDLLGSISDRVQWQNSEKKLEKASSAQASRGEAEEAATQFESILVQQMLKSMWNSVPKNGLLSGSSEERLYQELLQEQIASDISSGDGLGIKDMVLEELKKRGDF